MVCSGCDQRHWCSFPSHRAYKSSAQAMVRCCPWDKEYTAWSLPLKQKDLQGIAHNRSGQELQRWCQQGTSRKPEKALDVTGFQRVMALDLALQVAYPEIIQFPHSTLS